MSFPDFPELPDATSIAEQIVDGFNIYGRPPGTPRRESEQTLVDTITILVLLERSVAARLRPKPLEKLDIEQIIDHVAAWPTSEDVRSAKDAPDLIDDWIRLARRLRARDRSQDFKVIAGGKK